MINSISSTGFSATQEPRNNALTTDQKSLIEETLAKYNSDALSESDALEIVSAFSSAGIQPGKELEQVLGSFDFDAKEIGSLARADQPPPPPPSASSSSENIDLSELVKYIEEYLSQIDSEASTEESLYSNLIDHFGLEEGQSLISISV